jgi:hypothetical protein
VGKKSSLALKIVGMVLAVAVALPLGSWAAARTPVIVQAAFGSSGKKAVPTFCTHRRVRRLRRDSSAYHGNWSRALATSLSVSQSLHASRPEDRASLSDAVDLAPPDLPPA